MTHERQLLVKLSLAFFVAGAIALWVFVAPFYAKEGVK
jgi:hypothetical protein